MSVQSNNSSSPDGGDQVSVKLKESVEGLLSSAYQLRDALVARDIDAIWGNLAQQEEQASMLEEYSELWGELYGSTSDDTAEGSNELRDKIRHELSQIRVVQRSNFILARSLLSAVDKAMMEGTERRVPRSNAYDTRGRKQQKGESFFVRQRG